jgi:hypothetical protein
MSSSLEFVPVTPEKGQSLSFELKKSISPKYFGDDGSCHGGEAILTSEDVSFLEGMAAAGIKDARVLIDAIERVGAVKIYRV